MNGKLHRQFKIRVLY